MARRHRHLPQVGDTDSRHGVVGHPFDHEGIAGLIIAAAVVAALSAVMLLKRDARSNSGDL